jgi:hypothetical protein
LAENRVFFTKLFYNGEKPKTTTYTFGNLFHRTTPFWPSVSQLYFNYLNYSHSHFISKLYLLFQNYTYIIIPFHKPTQWSLQYRMIKKLCSSLCKLLGEKFCNMKWQWERSLMKQTVLPPFQIIRCFGFSRYIPFTMHLDIVYI